MRRIAVFVPEELLAGLKTLKAEHGVPESESIRRAIAAYLAEKGVAVKSPSKTRDRRRHRA
jgi:metal-responsive CopG/Arc/MetJ family transcriptional regulator